LSILSYSWLQTEIVPKHVQQITGTCKQSGSDLALCSSAAVNHGQLIIIAI
jgi:hypothetical protein